MILLFLIMKNNNIYIMIVIMNNLSILKYL